MSVSLINGHLDEDIVLKTEEECRNFIAKAFPDWQIEFLEDTGYMEFDVAIRKLDSCDVRFFQVKKFGGFIREIGV